MMSSALPFPLDRDLDAKRALLAQRLHGLAERAAVPLSFAQQRLWFLDQLQPESPLYNLPTLLELKGRLDLAALRRSLEALVDRHEILRTRFVCEDGYPGQVADDGLRLGFEFRDLTGLPEEERGATARSRVGSEARRPFDLGAEPPIRALVLRLQPEEHWLLLNMHHIVSDEWSVHICFRELAELYEAACRGREPELAELPIQYVDYALWQRQRMSPEVLGAELKFWERQLQGTPPVLEIPADRSRPRFPRFQGRTIARVLKGEARDAMKRLAGEQEATLFMVLLALFKVLLARYTQEEDIVVGTPVSGRNCAEAEQLIGFFVNTVVLRTNLSGNPTFKELVGRVREVTRAAWAHQEMPFEKLAEALRPGRTLDHMPFTRLMFVMQAPVESAFWWPDLEVRFLEVECGTSKFDLTLAMQETWDGLTARAEYNSDLFEAETVEALLRHFECLLEGVAADPERRLYELPMLTKAERDRILVEWNAGARGVLQKNPIHTLFEHQAQCRPKEIAAVFGGGSITYGELNERGNQVARRLQAMGVGPDVPVGLCCDRSLEMIIGMLAILKAGGAYLPLHPNYPKARLEFMLEDGRVPVLLTQGRILARLPQQVPNVVCLDSDWDLFASEPRENLPGRVLAENPACLIYTSGSSGQPKAVSVPHRAISRLVIDTNYVQITPRDRVAQVSNMCFDAATFEIWGALLNGARLVGIDLDVALSSEDFANELVEQRISILFLTTARFNQIAAEAPWALGTVRTVLFGGESADPLRVREVLKRYPQRLIHVYGPTESTTFATWHRVEHIGPEARSIPIGAPVTGTQCYVLDGHLNPVPAGVPGELHLAGEGLALGYWRQPELTSRKFIPNPFTRGLGDSILYKTGDRARWLPGGKLEFLGRFDDQVKIRGFRVEPGETEAVLRRHPGIRDCVVVAREETEGFKRLVGYFVPGKTQPPTDDELRRFLQSTLPDYLVPSTFVSLPALPLNAYGKVDHCRLPDPETRRRAEGSRRVATARDSFELKLTEIWESVLGIRPIGIEDQFFDLGGHSLLAVRLLAQVEKVFGVKVRLSTLFEATTIERLASAIRLGDGNENPSRGSSLVEIRSEGKRAPIYFVHGAGGGMFWGYANISRRLGEDQPVYGLKARPVEDGEPFERIEELAARYVSDVRTMQPHGPYRLGGYCFGGNVAYEMARQLQSQGEQVELLALLNCTPPNSSYERPGRSPLWALRFLKNLLYWANYCRRWSALQRREFIRWKQENLRRRLSRTLAGGKSGSKIDVAGLVDLSSYSPDQRRLWEAHIRALAAYRPQPYHGTVHLFRSPGHPVICSYAADYGWSELVDGGVRIRVVPGVHEKILEEPCVEIVADELREILDQVSKDRKSDGGELRGQCPDREERDLDYWRGKLKGAPALLELPADRHRPAKLGNATGRETIRFNAEFTSVLEQFCIQESLPMFVVLLAGFEALLARYTGHTDIITGGYAKPQGTGPLPFRGDLSDDPTFREWVRRLRQVVSEASSHPLPLEEIIKAIGAAPDPSYAPLFQSMLVLEEDVSSPERLGTASCAALDLVFRLHLAPEGLSGILEYNSDLFEAGRAARMTEHFGTLMGGALTRPDERCSVLPLLPDEELGRVLVEWTSTEKEYPGCVTLGQLFEAQVERTPEAIALVDCTRPEFSCNGAGSGRDERRLTYRELNARVNQLAHYLRSLGVGPEVPVAICLERSWKLVVGILAILKAGGAYVPMDPAYPRERLAFVLEDARVPVLLAHKSSDLFPARGGVRVIDPDEEADAIGALGTENPFSGVEPSNLAYVIYTSGSTGKPKGVALEHRNAVALIFWARDNFAPEEIAGVLASTSVCFDLSVFEMFVPLSWGGKVILIKNAMALPGLADAREVTLINTVPSAIQELLQLKGVPPSIRVVNLAGEPLTSTLADRIYQETSAEKVYDLYGPSETATYSTFALRRPTEPATIGRPLANERVYLLDRHLQPVPIGVPGEIYIGGAGVARGYLNRSELTREKFLPDPFHPGARVYRTGDHARWRVDGSLEFLGRLDHQVKLRGFRIELGEIESVLLRHPALQEGTVLVREDQPGDKRLVAYVVLRPGMQAGAGELRRFARESLPEYQVPSAFVFLEKLPLTPNGKVDRKSLPVPDAEQRVCPAERVAPRNSTEEKLAGIWEEVLGVKQVGVHDNFFELGGHSLLAIRVISRMRESFRVELPLSILFDTPTIAALAEGLEAGRWGNGSHASRVERVARDGAIPGAFVQEQLWFFDQIQPGSYAYNMPMAFRLKGPLDAEGLQRALDEMVRRHEALRTQFRYADGELRQVIAPEPAVVMRKMTVAELPREEREPEARRQINAMAQEAFDLAKGPLFRVGLLQVEEHDHVLVAVAHHIIFDGWSWAIFFEELGLLYDSFARGEAPPVLPELRVQYVDFAHWRRGQMTGPLLQRELAYWKVNLKDAPASIDLPTDREEPEQLSDRADERMVVLPPEIVDRLTGLAHREGSTPFIVLMTALAATFEKWTQQQDMVFGTVVAGRNRREWESVIGCFMNFLPLRTRIAGDETGRVLLDKIRSVVLEAQAHQDSPFEKIVEEINPQRHLNQNPLYNVALLLQNFPEELFRGNGLQVSRMTVDARAPLVDLRFEAIQRKEGMSLVCEFNTDLFDGATIAELLSCYAAILKALLDDPDRRLSEITLSDRLKAQAARARARKNQQTIVVAATFTAEPVGESLRYWIGELGIQAQIRFAPFNQVFQQLLAPGSLISRNAHGLNVVLVRLEDWRNPDAGDAGAGAGDLERSAHEFVSAVRSAAGRAPAPMLVVLCPDSPAARSEAETCLRLDRLEQVVASGLAGVDGVDLVTRKHLLELYPVSDYDDPRSDELGRVPYTPVLFTAVGTLIARRFHARLRPVCKVIALDCDQTLWEGVCGEDGPDGIRMDESRKALQEFMRAQLDSGRLLVLCSKNNEADVEDVFARRRDFILRREHFAACRLNWKPKSENLKSLAAELNLGLESFVFVDDNPLECAEVEANCPEAVVVQLPEDPARTAQFLKHCWVFDRLAVTEEDRSRGQFYRQGREREQFRQESLSLADFLGGLELKIRIERLSEDQAARAAQLTQRTNQFNCTTVRRNEGEIRRLAESGRVLGAWVSDRFGDYGMVGLVVYELKGKSLDVETFLLSCRVLGRGVEHRILARLGEMAGKQDARWVDVHFHPSPKNLPALDFLRRVGADVEQPLNGGFLFRFPAESAAKITLDPNAGNPVAGFAPQRRVVEAGDAAPAATFARYRMVALEADDAAKIQRALESKTPVCAAVRGDTVPPQTQLEKDLCSIWQTLLRIEPIGTTDNFFELGGHSLLAVRLFSEVERAVGRKLPLVTIFQAPTIRQLARVLEEAGAQRPSPLVPVQSGGERPPLFLVHGAGGDVLWGYANLAAHLRPDQPIYGIKSRGQVGLEEYDRVEDMARYYLEEVQALQPDGPYYLGGYCFGGNIAYEMARQLQARGEQVALVALLDASATNVGYERVTWWQPTYPVRFARNLACWLGDFADLPRAERRRYFARKARVLARKVARKFQSRRPAGPEVDLEEVIDPNHFPERELVFWRIHLRAAVAHVEQPYAGKVTLIRTRGQPLFCSLADDFGWTRVARGGVEVRRIPGSHENIFLEPNVRHLARELDACLTAAQEEAGAPPRTGPAVSQQTLRPTASA